MMHNTEKLTRLERSTLIEWFMYHLDMDSRQRLMTELPYRYAKLTGSSPHEWSVDIIDEIHHKIRN